MGRGYKNSPAAAACPGAWILAIIGPMKERFVHAGRASDVPPGAMICVELRGRRILVANVGGAFYATDDTCTHEDASLASGFLDGELVKCPLHGSRFNVRTGEPMEEPAEEPLRCYAVKVEDGAVLIELPSESRA